MKIVSLFCVAVSLLAVPGHAQTVWPCDGWQANARNIAEPWEDSVRTFANGAVRVVMLDTLEPAFAAYHLMVLSPPYDELGDRQCRLISAEGENGFAGMMFSQLSAGYDPATGLGLDVPVVVYLTQTGDFQTVGLGLTINQATGAIDARIYPVD